MREIVSFRVNSRGVSINFKPEASFLAIKEALNRHAREASEFFAGVNIYVNCFGHNFSLQEMQELIEILTFYKKAENIFFQNEVVDNKAEKSDTLLINRTIRSGQKIKYPNNVVIIGDINPGAEVIAGGDIIVLGKLRGVVHAGAAGAQDAQVIALKLLPTQLRIANIISRSPDEIKESPDKAERAYVRDGVIIVEELKI